MNRIVTGFQFGVRSTLRQNTFTKLDFFKTKLVIKALVLGAFVVALSIFYIWSRVQIIQTGYEINEFRNKELFLQDQNRSFNMELSLMKSPSRIDGLAQKQMHLSFPGQDRIVKVE